MKFYIGLNITVHTAYRFGQHQLSVATFLLRSFGCIDTHFMYLTLRLLMSYIYIYIYIYMEHLFLMFLDHTQRRSTVGRTPLDE